MLCFAVRRGEIKGRLDVTYNNPINLKVPNTVYNYLPLTNLVITSFSGGTPSKNKPEYWDGNIPWASPKDFINFYMDDTQDHVSEKGVEATSLNLIPPETVLVVVRSDILKHTLPVAVTTQPMVINQDIKALILKPALIPDYLGLYLSILGHKLLPTISKHSTTVQSINTEQFNSLLIPVPSLDIQHRLVSEMQAARPTRQQKLAQAETLLAGLDGYLLERLGLTLPTENKQKAFAIQMRQIQGKRIDALAYRPYYDAKNQLPETPTRPLGEIAYTA